MTKPIGSFKQRRDTIIRQLYLGYGQDDPGPDVKIDHIPPSIVREAAELALGGMLEDLLARGIWSGCLQAKVVCCGNAE